MINRGSARPRGGRLRAALSVNAYYYIFMLLPLLVLGLFYFYPLLRVVAVAFTEPDFGLGNFAALFQNQAVWNVLTTTARICILTTVISVLLAYLLSYVIIHSSKRWHAVMMFCVVLTFWISVLVRAFSWVTLLQTQGVVNSLLLATGIIDGPLMLVRNEGGVILGMIHYLLPYAVFPIYANMRGIDQRVVAAARSLGATPTYAFRRIYLPLSVPGLLAATILVFVFSLGFYITPAILGGGRVMMIAEYISVNVFETLRWGLAAALAVSLLIVVFFLVLLMNRIGNVNGAYAGR